MQRTSHTTRIIVSLLLALATSTSACAPELQIAQAEAQDSDRSIAGPPTPAPEPGFIKVSRELREAIGTINKLGPSDSISMLRGVRKNMLIPAADKQLAAYVLGDLLRQSPTAEDKAEAIKLFQEAAGNEALATSALLKAANIAFSQNDEKTAQAVLMPLFKRADSLARSDRQSKTAAANLIESRDPVLPEALYRLAESFYRSNDIGSATNVFERVRELFPDSEFGIGSSYYLGSMAIDNESDIASGLKEYRNYLRRCPQGKNAVKIAYRLLTMSGTASGGTGASGSDSAAGAGEAHGGAAGNNPGSSNPDNNLTPDTTSGATSDDTNGGGRNSSAGQIAPGTAAVKLTASDHDLIALAFYKHAQYAEALKEWNKIGSHSIFRAHCLSKTGQRQAAADALLAAIRANPKDPAIPDVASALCVPLTTKDALALWQQIIKQNPARMDLALWNIGKRLDYPQDTQYYRKLVATYPSSEFAPESAWWLIWNTMTDGFAQNGAARNAKFAQALELCDHALGAYRNTHVAPKFAFWKGKLHEALNQPGKAIAAYQQAADSYPESYYGSRSAYRLIHLQSVQAANARGKHGHAGASAERSSDDGDETSGSGSGSESGSPSASATASIAGSRASKGQNAGSIPDRKWTTIVGRRSPDPDWTWPEPPRVFRWQSLPNMMGYTAALLIWLRQYDEALRFINTPLPPEVKAWLYLKTGKIMQGVGTAGFRLEGQPEPTTRWELAYPLGYADIVDQETRKNAIDPLLVHAVIRQESRYDPNAISRSNAMGLMQLLKGTAYGVAKHNGITLTSPKDIFQPRTNIQLGTAYLAYVLRRNDGNAMLAVASYNGGPNAVTKWLKQHQAKGLSDMDVYVENIPYDETRDYVRKVFAHYWNYERIYKSKD